MKKTYYLGIDVGGTSVKAAIIYGKDDFLPCKGFLTGKTMEQSVFVQKIIDLIGREYSENLLGVGIGTLGFVDSKSGTILSGAKNVPCLAGLKLKDILIKRFPDLKISVINDATAAALGEKWAGAAQDTDNFFCITFGTGLGGCLVLNGKVIEGAHHRSGEIGFYDYEDEENYLELRHSTKSIVAYAGKILQDATLDGFAFFEKIRNGDAVCVAIFDEWMRRMGRVLANVIIVIDVEKIIVGGGISKEESLVIPHLTQCIDEMLPPNFRGQCKIEAATCANDAGVLGAVYNLLHERA